MFIYLNKTCFRGLHRVGPNGFNVPYGNYASLNVVLEEDVFSLSHLFRNVEFLCCDFREQLDKVSEGDFIYLDPPYYTEEKKFTKYTKKDFSAEDNLQIFEFVKKCPHKCMMSNSSDAEKMF